MDIPPQIKYAQGDSTVENGETLSTSSEALIKSKESSNKTFFINSNLEVCSGSHSSTFEDPSSAIPTENHYLSNQLLPASTVTHAASNLELNISERNLSMELPNKDELLTNQSDDLPVKPMPLADPTFTESSIKNTLTDRKVENEIETAASQPSTQPSSSKPVVHVVSSPLNSTLSSISNSTLFEITNMPSISAKPSFSIVTSSPGASALGSSSIHSLGKSKPSLKDVLYSSTASQTAFPALVDRTSARPGPNFQTSLTDASVVQFQDGLMRPLAAQPQLPRSIALPLPLVARLSNEPQFIKPFPEEPPKGFNDNQFFFNQGLSNFSSGQQSLNSSNKTSRNFEFKRSSPSLENFDNNEDSSRSPRKGKRPRKYVRSGKYSKLKRKGSEEGECSPCPTSLASTPAQNPVSRSAEYAPTNVSTSTLSNTKPPKEIEHNRSIKERIDKSLQFDKALVASPDYSRPFENLKDAFERLMPYHLFQYHDNTLKADTEVNPSVSKIEKSYKFIKGRLSSLGTKLRDEERRILPLSILVDHLLVKDALSLDARQLNNVDNGQSSVAPTTPLFERLSSAAPSEPTVE